MENDADWIYVEDNDQSDIESVTSSNFEKIDQEDLNMKNKDTYAAALLKNAQQNHQHRSVLSIVEKKEKSVNKRDDDCDLLTAPIEAKPGSQYRNPRDNAGKNKVHNGKRKWSPPPPKNLGNSLKVGGSFDSERLANRAERKRNARQECSIAN